jgi:MFS family permease
MTLFSLIRPARAVPAEYRATFLHLYFDILWFGVLNGSALSFLAVYAARQGANSFQLGLLAASGALVNLFLTLPVGRWLAGRHVGKAVFWAAVFHRLFYLLWVPLPVLLPPSAQVWAFIGITFLMSIPGVVLAVGFNALFADAVPPEWRGHVVGVRNALFALALITSTLISGQLLDSLSFPLGYQIVFAIGFVGAALSTVHLWFVRAVPGVEPPPRVGRPFGELASPGMLRIIGDALRGGVGLRFLTRARGLRLLRRDILRGPFGAVLATLFAFHLAQYSTVPLFSLYWVRHLHLSDEQIGLGTALFWAMVLLGSTQFAALTQRLGHRRMVVFGGMLISLYPALMALSREFGLFMLASAVGGLGWSLFGGALTNYLLDRTPADDRPAHLAWYNLVLNASILLGSLIGPFIADRTGLGAALALLALARALGALAIQRWG